MVPMAVPKMHFLTDLYINFKVVVFQNAINLVRSSAEIVSFTRLPSAFLEVSRIASWGILGIGSKASAVTIIAFCVIWSTFFSLLIKLPKVPNIRLLYSFIQFPYNWFKLPIEKKTELFSVGVKHSLKSLAYLFKINRKMIQFFFLWFLLYF